MKNYYFKTNGTCSSGILLKVDGEVLKEVTFQGGCSGNTQGVAALAAGRTVDEVISLIKGIRCGMKPTSCPDQLAEALVMIKEGNIGGRLRVLEETA